LVLVAIVAAACSRKSPHEASPSAAAGTPTSTAKLVPQAERTVRVVPAAGAPTRAELREDMFGAAFVEPEQLLRTLDAAKQAVLDFAAYAETPVEAKMLLAHFSNHDVRNHDLRELATHTMEAMRGVPNAPSSQIYTASDAMTYPRVLVVWQFPNSHKALRINENNDNKAVYFLVGLGEFSASAYGLSNLKKIPPGRQVLETASFLDDAMTIYPHIEEYFVCPPECE